MLREAVDDYVLLVDDSWVAFKDLHGPVERPAPALFSSQRAAQRARSRWPRLRTHVVEVP